MVGVLKLMNMEHKPPPHTHTHVIVMYNAFVNVTSTRLRRGVLTLL